MTTHVVPDSVREITLARYLSRAWPMTPGWVFREALKKKDVRVNGARADGDAIVRGGDTLLVYIADKYLFAPAAVLFQDGDMLVADKPAGLPVDDDGDNVGCDTLLRRVRALCPDARLCHRLDTGTGGPVVFSLNDAAHARLLDDFRAHRVEKEYQCITRGAPSPREGALTHFLLKDASAASVRVLDHPAPGALTAELRYATLREEAPLALLSVRLLTGRTHQIRAQMAHIGHPLLGDDKYGDRALNKSLRVYSPQLWCVSLTLRGQTWRSAPRFVPLMGIPKG